MHNKEKGKVDTMLACCASEVGHVLSPTVHMPIKSEMQTRFAP